MAQSRSSKHFFILGEPVLKRTVYLGIVSVFIVGGGLLLLGYVLMLKNAAPVVVASVPSPVDPTERSIVAEPVVVVSEGLSQPVAALSSPAPIKRLKASSLSELLDRHLKATGFGELDALIVNGVASATSQAFEVTFMARRPNLYKLKTESDRLGLMSQFGYDGREGWFEHQQMNLAAEEIEFFMRVALFESSMTQLAWSYQSDEAREFGLDKLLERLPSEQWQGRACEVVVSRGLLPFTMYHYIDQNTYEEVYRRAQIQKGSELVDVALKLAPSDATASTRIPMGYELYIDGELHDTVRVTKVRANRTILSSLFDAPANVSFSGLSTRR